MFYKSSQRPLYTVHPIYLRYTDLAHKCNQLFLILHKSHWQISTNTTCTKLREHPHITPSDRCERGFVARFTFSSYTIWWSKYTTMKTYLRTTWYSNRMLLGWLQVNSVTRVHHAIYANWLQPFVVCHWNFHLLSLWLTLSLLCDVSYITAKWEALMINSPLLSSVAYITEQWQRQLVFCLLRPFILLRVTGQFFVRWNYSRNGNCPLDWTSYSVSYIRGVQTC